MRSLASVSGGNWVGDEQAARIADLEGQLRESERRLEESEALARVGSWNWKLPELRSTWSRELLRIFGRDPDGPPPAIEELIASVHPEDRDRFRDLVARVRSTPGPFQYSYRIVDGDGEVHHLQARGRTVTDTTGTPIRAYGTTQDISELRRSEAQLEQAQRLESVGQLAGGVAHDFNNLLSVILNYTECLIAEADDEETVESLREIERAAGTAAELTRRLLLFSRRDTSELQAVDLVAVVRDTEGLLRRTIGENLELTVDAPSGLPPVGLAGGQAEQLLVNLVVNARDALPRGGTIAVKVRELRLEEPHSEPVPNLPPGAPHLVLTVSDDGVGMSREVAAQAFDPFFTTKPRDKGTGLGLATVYGIVTRAGGHVEIESEPGRGTSVRVYLPVAVGLDAPEPPQRDPRSAGGAGRTVLVVDNEEAVGTVVSHMLRRKGYRAETACSGSEAEAILTASESDVDLLLTDLLMPSMSGRELVSRVRARRPDLPAIYMSGYGDDVSALGRRDDDVTILQKPFTGAQLLEAVDEALAGG